ncbi:DUF4175 domain-containing protein [Pseudomonas sp. R5(2019)]|uniref:DUF4175 domain-containing protein n=1 Tax=Pseudomonas sp. R5(2019) TaxID=2697566 RepID=UPI0014128CC5|nr:DUF4175 domain-containing protein [Pseudomonas sp. R5(2019)]NBA96305.1 hypothetical protein [Pseudomonas sp. R5(2019)]
MLLKTIAQAIAILGGLLTLGLTAYAAQGSDSGSFTFLALVMVWAASPYAALFMLARRATASGYWPAVLVVSTLAVLMFGLYLFWLGFFAQPDPQSGLLFIVLPFYQLAFVVVIFVVGALTKAWST